MNALNEIRKIDPEAYRIANHKPGWLRQICEELNIPIKRPKGYYNNLEACLKEALKYETIGAWSRDGRSSSHKAALANPKWYKICTAHMKVPNNRTDAYILKKALTYKTRSKWKLGDPDTYNKACNNKALFTKCTAHMPAHDIMPLGHWKVEANIIIELQEKKFKSATEWKTKSGGSHTAARRAGILKKLKIYLVN